MGQGNAIAHLMPPPFYAYRYVVAKARAPEESIQGQIDKIIDATATNRYKIEVMPGIYVESVTMKQYVDVVAPYGRVRIQPASLTAAVTMASDSMLQGIQVSQTNQADNATGIVIGDKTNVVVEDCWVTGGTTGDIGISDASTGTAITGPVIRRCRVDSAFTGYQKTGTGTSYLEENRVTSLTDGIDIDVNAGTLNILDNELLGTGTGANVDVAAAAITVNSFHNSLNGDGWQIGNNANAKVFSHDDAYTKVTHAGAGFMVDYESPQSYNVFNGMKIADALTDITDAIDTKRYSILVHPGEYNETITMDQYVDLVGDSNQSCVIYQTEATVITCAANSRVKSVRVEVTAALNNQAIYCNNVYGYLEDVVVAVAHSGGVNYCVASAGTGGFEIHDCYFTINSPTSYCFNVNGSGSHNVYDSELQNTGDLAYAVIVRAGYTLSSYNNKLLSDNGFWLVSDAATVVLSYGDDFTTVAWSGATGLFADLTDARLYTCAADIAIGEWVYASGNDTVARADADALATMPTIGRVVYKPDGAAGLTCYVKNAGYAYDANTNTGHGDVWVAGQEYWVSATAGQITTTMHPVWPQRAGVALSTQRFKILIGDNLGLVHCNEYQCATGTIVAGQWVYITATNDVVGLADSDAATTMGAIGVCVAVLVVGATDTILVKLRGKNVVNDVTAAWVASDDVYISGTPGAITNVMPVGGIIQKVAEVKSFATPVLTYEIAD